MTGQHHGFSVGMERSGNILMLTMRAKGKLTHEDYQALVPMLESALGNMQNPKINVLMDVSELEGWEMRAAWDDLKLGVKHGREFNRIAMVGHQRWQEVAAKMGSWFIGGKMRSFEQEAAALEWLQAGS